MRAARPALDLICPGTGTPSLSVIDTYLVGSILPRLCTIFPIPSCVHLCLPCEPPATRPPVRRCFQLPTRFSVLPIAPLALSPPPPLPPCLLFPRWSFNLPRLNVLCLCCVWRLLSNAKSLSNDTPRAELAKTSVRQLNASRRTCSLRMYREKGCKDSGGWF